MEYRVLKGTDLELSVITFGTIWFARPGADPSEGKRAMHLALDEGVNSIHSSYEYLTRPVVRQVLDERKSTAGLKHIIKTPCPDKAHCPTFDPAYLTKLVDDALQELNCDRIDLLQWILRDDSTFNPAESIANFERYKDDLKATFDKLHDQGKAGFLGTFCYTNEFTQAAARSGIFSSMLFYYNIWDTCLLPSFDALRELGIGIVPFRPFQGGLLTEKRRVIANLPADDKMNNPRGLKMLEKRDELLRRAGIDTNDLTRFAMKFVIGCDLTGTIITGMNTPDQVRDVLAAVDGDYPPADLADKVYAAAKELGGPWTT